MQRRFGRGLTRPSKHAALSVDGDELSCLQHALIDSARGNRKGERVCFEHRAEVATRAKCPTASIELPSCLRKKPSDILESLAHGRLRTSSATGNRWSSSPTGTRP